MSGATPKEAIRPTYETNMTQHKPELYNKNASFVYSDAATAPVLGLLALKPGERVLDLGCGSGELTVRLVEAAGDEGCVWGTDSNEEMLRKAKSLHPKLADKTFQADAQSLTLPEGAGLEHSFDKVFTSAVLHWCKRDPAGVLEGVKRVLKPGGSFIGEAGGFQNCSAIRSHLHQVLRERGLDPEPRDPFYYPTATAYRRLLEDHGFTVDSCELVPRPTPLPTNLVGWLTTFCRKSFLADLDDTAAEEVMQEVSRRCEPDCRDEEGKDHAMYVRLRFVARL